jgi:transposase
MQLVLVWTATTNWCRFLFEQADNGTLTIKRNLDKIELAAKNFGFFCLLTNTSLNSSEVLEQYRRKDAIEKSFDDVKNHIDMKRLRTHTTATTDGKLFCAFLALIVVSEIGAKLGDLMKKKSMSKAGMIREMDKIYAGQDKNGWRLLNPVTKTQRSLINGLGLREDDLQAYIAARS